MRARARRYYERHRERLLAEGREKWAAASDETRETRRARWREYRRSDLVGYLLRAARCRAKRRGLDFSLFREDIEIPDSCPVLGIPLLPSRGASGPGSPTLDRIDNAKGYVPGNVIVISHRANSIKRDATPEELVLVAEFYRRPA